jgi:hypothetical protein
VEAAMITLDAERDEWPEVAGYISEFDVCRPLVTQDLLATWP